jgi:hypothetical protein
MGCLAWIGAFTVGLVVLVVAFFFWAGHSFDEHIPRALKRVDALHACIASAEPSCLESLLSTSAEDALRQHAVFRRIREQLGGRISAELDEDKWSYKQSTEGNRLEFSMNARYENDDTVTESYVVVEQDDKFRFQSVHFESERIEP